MIDYELFSSKGERAENEDSVRIVDKGSLKAFILADGLGGCGKGEIASLAAVKAVENYILENEFDSDMLRNCFVEAQKGVLDAQKENDYYEMKTTLVVLLINGKKAFWGHIGDSRLYVFNGKKYEYRTSDHSVTQVLYKLGEIKEDEIRHHNDRNKLLRALGSEDLSVENLFECGGENVDVFEKDFLLCSDGFWEWITEKEMQKILKNTKTPSAWINQMASKVVENGCGNNMDNLSAIVVRY